MDETEVVFRGGSTKEWETTLGRILWIARSGAVWRDLPERYGAWQTVYKWFVQWPENGLQDQIFHVLSADVDYETLSIDSTYIKAHKTSVGAQRGDS